MLIIIIVNIIKFNDNINYRFFTNFRDTKYQNETKEGDINYI